MTVHRRKLVLERGIKQIQPVFAQEAEQFLRPIPRWAPSSEITKREAFLLKRLQRDGDEGNLKEIVTPEATYSGTPDTPPFLGHRGSAGGPIGQQLDALRDLARVRPELKRET